MVRLLERKCNGETEAVDEIALVGIRTRARAALDLAASSGGSSSLPASKIRKVSSSTTKLYNVNELKKRQPATVPPKNSVSFRLETTTTTTTSASEVVETPMNSETCEIGFDFPAAPSCCSSNKDRFEITADPEVATPETSPTCVDHRRARRERNSGGSDDQESQPKHGPDSKSTAEISKMPSDSEIEEFFCVAEKDLHKRFTDKYNFDVVKDIPLEGRYEWVPIKPLKN